MLQQQREQSKIDTRTVIISTCTTYYECKEIYKNIQNTIEKDRIDCLVVVVMALISSGQGQKTEGEKIHTSVFEANHND